jgi:hypothetical protein
MAEDVLEVVGGQDRGARFSLHGSEAVIGRDPAVDLMLTDPAVSARHASLRVEGERLVIRDLGSESGTSVNGRAVDAPTALRAGDRVRLGATEMAVLWPPGVQPPPQPAPEPASIPTVPVRAPAPTRDPPRSRQGRDLAHVALAAAVIALSAMALGAVWIDFAEHSSLWGTDQNWLRAQGIGGPLAGLAVGAGWLVAAARGPARRVRDGLAVLAAGIGGLVAGLPTAIATTRGLGGREAGLWLTVAAGAAVAVCGLAGAMLSGRGPGPRAAVAVGGAAGVVGGALAAAGAPLDWLGTGVGTVDGFDLRAGKCLLAIALLVVVAFSGLVAARWLGRDRTAATLAPVGVALAGLLLGFAGAYVTAFVLGTPLTAESGLVLAVVGAVVAALGGLVTVLARTLVRPAARTSGPPEPGLR